MGTSRQATATTAVAFNVLGARVTSIIGGAFQAGLSDFRSDDHGIEDARFVVGPIAASIDAQPSFLELSFRHTESDGDLVCADEFARSRRGSIASNAVCQ